MLENLLRMTWYNPLFMMVVIGSIWFIPGIVLRRIAEKRYRSAKAQDQAQKIARLYPKKNHSGNN